MTSENICRPYPEQIEALEAKLREAEHEIEALRLRIAALMAEVEMHKLRSASDVERIAALEAMLDAMETHGHGQPCYYCGEPCSRIAGNPNQWPVALCHEDEPGVVKWHHTGCVTDRLYCIAALEAENERHNEAMELREFEAYQIIGHLADRAGLFEHPEIIRALDWFAYPDNRPEAIFPWPNGGLRDAESTGQHDLPPTRAEERTLEDSHTSSELDRLLRGADNEELD